jgi:LmbE family N-acetylglucosaminyl deacetylase
MKILIAVAHADDETLGCYSVLRTAGCDVRILHATDSTPLPLRYAEQAGYGSVAEYRIARRAEMLAALAVLRCDEARWTQLPFADQDAPRNVTAIRETALSFGADRIYTHAYEGGHPDHDAVAFALRGLAEVWEFPLYHASEVGEFAPGGFIVGEAAETVDLSGELREGKRRTLDCFHSQQRVIQRIPIGVEWFRPMRAYDFSKPPHEGPLYYEIRQHGWMWPEWREAVSTS